MAIIDSGTSNIILPPQHFDVFKKRMFKMKNCLDRNDSFICACSNNLNLYYPTIKLLVGSYQKGFYNLMIEPKHYMFKVNMRDQTMCKVRVDTLPNLQHVLLGIPFFRAYHTTFNVETSSFGLMGLIEGPFESDSLPQLDLTSPSGTAAAPINEHDKMLEYL